MNEDLSPLGYSEKLMFCPERNYTHNWFLKGLKSNGYSELLYASIFALTVFEE